MTGDDIERVCIDAVKTAILDSRQELRLSDVELAVKRQKKRMKSALASLPVDQPRSMGSMPRDLDHLELPRVRGTLP